MIEGINLNEIDLAGLENIVSSRIEELKELPLVKKAFEMLDELPSYLRYHTKAHTEDVLHEAMLLATIDGLDENEITTLAIAVAWHDIGYLVRPNSNEEVAVDMFDKDDLSNLLDKDTKEIIKRMIMDTKVHITENGPEIIMSHERSAHLLDADVGNFGRLDFFDKSRLIAEESGVDLNKPEAKLKFFNFALALLRNHEWHTRAAQQIRGQQTINNYLKLEEEIEKIKSDEIS